MEKLIDRLSAVVAEAFSAAGYDPACGRVTVSNRPDLCEFQCNGAMPAAKQHHKAPLVIAQDVVDRLQDGSVFASAEAVKPGFINLRVQPAYLAAHLEQMRQSERLGVTDGDRVRLTSRFGTCEEMTTFSSSMTYSWATGWQVMHSARGPSTSWVDASPPT